MKYSVGDKVYFSYCSDEHLFKNCSGFGVVVKVSDENFYDIQQTHSEDLIQIMPFKLHIRLYHVYLKPAESQIEQKILQFKKKKKKLETAKKQFN